MATQTFQFGSMLNGSVVFELDINNANWRVSQARVINNSNRNVEVLIHKAGVLVFNQIAPAGETTTWNTSGLQFDWQEDYWDSDIQEWVPGGIELFDYTVGARTL